MEKFYIESVSTLVRTFSFVGMILGNAPIKVLSEFAKTHPALELKGGIVDGKETSKEETL